MRARERGNAVVIILVAVALFGALAYTFMRGAKSGQGNLTAGQAKILAQDIISDSIAVERAVNKLLVKGCSEKQLNFYSPQNPHPINASAPADKHCNIFSSEGAGLTMNTYDGNTGLVGPTAQVDTLGSETTAGDMTYFYTSLTDNVCREINKQLGITNPETIPQDTSPINGVWFTGTFYPAGTADSPINDEDSRLQNRFSGCVHVVAMGVNIFAVMIMNR